MGLPRSTYYDAPPVKTDDAEIVANITAICDEFEAYGYRRVGAEQATHGYCSIAAGEWAAWSPTRTTPACGDQSKWTVSYSKQHSRE